MMSRRRAVPTAACSKTSFTGSTFCAGPGETPSAKPNKRVHSTMGRKSCV
jgi:hypothetical protein